MAINKDMLNKRIQEIQDELESVKITPDTTMRDDEIITILGAVQLCSMHDLIEDLENVAADPSTQQPKKAHKDR